MSARFNISTFGRTYISYEPIVEQLKPIRLIFVFVTLIVGIVTLLKILKSYSNLGQLHKRYFPNATSQPLLVNWIYFLFILNVVIHNAHYADNIYRPVAYFEPKYLYDKYLLSTMEITFYANFPISVIGTMAIKGIFEFDRSGLVINRSSCRKMFGFIAGSMLTILHYRTEPPTSYQWSVNLTIAGEGLVTIMLTISTIYCLLQAKKDEKYELVSQLDVDEVLSKAAQISKTASTRFRSPRRVNN